MEKVTGNGARRFSLSSATTLPSLTLVFSAKDRGVSHVQLIRNQRQRLIHKRMSHKSSRSMLVPL